MAKNVVPKTSLTLMHMSFSALDCLIKHTHLKEQAAKSWRLIKILFHVCINLDGTEFHFKLQENQTAMMSKTHGFCHALHVTIGLLGLPGWHEVFGEFVVSLGRSVTWQSSKILLFFYHCPAHPEAVGKFKIYKWSLLLQMWYQFCNL